MYKRVLLKLSGEALMAGKPYGIDSEQLQTYAAAVKDAVALGVQVGVVFGGGNIFRGLKGTSEGYDRVKGDYMGMLATVINGLAIQSALESLGVPARLFTAFGMEPVGERYTRDKAVAALERGEVAIFSAGTGNPYFTTDTASALRAVEINADALLKGTRVDGVYTADPEKDPSAVKFDTITYDEVYRRNLKVMDLTSITLCKENGMKMVVFDMNTPGALRRVLLEEKEGTLITA
ncbi:MAG: UMP kinase [Bacteroidales bacterium]|nr:UMP kinase [Bacteroidales bacterium]